MHMKVSAIHLIRYLRPIAKKYNLRLNRWSDIKIAMQIAAKLN